MRITSFTTEPVAFVPFLNAGRGPGQFYEDQLPVHIGRVNALPDGVSALVATSDLQGRERFEDSPGGRPRLLGETSPRRLADEILPELGVQRAKEAAALLAGDFYTVPDLDRRGGTGDVTAVWNKFADVFGWVVGVAGNHDTLNEDFRSPSHVQYLDGEVAKLCGIRIAGIGGIIGRPTKNHRRTEKDYLATLKRLVAENPDLLLMHEGPDGPHRGQRGMPSIREALDSSFSGLVIRGHAHWSDPFVEFDGGLQVLNVDARAVVLTE